MPRLPAASQRSVQHRVRPLAVDGAAVLGVRVAVFFILPIVAAASQFS
jgi:hypothetical protein